MRDKESVQVTARLLYMGESKNGGWNREQLAVFGVHWPPGRDWMRSVIGMYITQKEADRFLHLKNKHLKNRRRKKTSRLARLPESPEEQRRAMSKKMKRVAARIDDKPAAFGATLDLYRKNR